MANVDSRKNKLKTIKMLWIFVLLLFAFTESVPLSTGSTTTTTTTTTTQSPSSTTTTLQTDNGQAGTARSSLTDISEDKNILLSANDKKVQDTNDGVVKQQMEGTAEKKNDTETTTTSKQNAENKETKSSQAVNQVVVTTVRPDERVGDKILTETESPVIMPININNLSDKQTSQKPVSVNGGSSVTTTIKTLLKDLESDNNLSVDDDLSGSYIKSYNLVTDRKNNNDASTSAVSLTTTETTTTQNTAKKVTMTSPKQIMEKTSSSSGLDIWSSDWDDSEENEESEKKTDDDDDWSILEDGKDDSLLPVGDQTDGENNIADKFGDFWDERTFNQRPYIKEGLVTLIPDKEERKMENEISMITYYSWILFFTFLLLTVFVFFRQRHIFSAYWSRNNGPRTRHSSGSEEGKSLMKNVYA